MKKLIATFLTIAMMAIVVPMATNAQTRNSKRYKRDTNSRNYEGNNKNIYQRHRNALISELAAQQARSSAASSAVKKAH